MIVFDGCGAAVLATDEGCWVELDFAPLAPGVRRARLTLRSNEDVMFFDEFEENL